MKHILAVIPLFLLLTLLAGCGQRTRVEAQLDTLDSILSIPPDGPEALVDYDSIFHQLDSLQPSVIGDDALEARWNLLFTMAEDKSDRPLLLDLRIRPAYDYYAAQTQDGTRGDSILLHRFAQSCFYLGAHYYQCDSLARMEQLMHRSAEVSKSCGDHYTAYLALTYLSYQLRLDNSEEATKMSEEALKEYELTQHTNDYNYISLLLNTGAIWLYSPHQEKALNYYEKALNCLKTSEDSVMYAFVYGFMAVYYNMMNDRQKAVEHLEKASKYISEKDNDWDLEFAQIYLNNHDFDKAEALLNSSRTSSPLERFHRDKFLQQIKILKGDINGSLELNDSLSSYSNKMYLEALSQKNSYFKDNFDKEKKLYQQRQHFNKLVMLYSLVVLAVLAAIGFILLHLRHKGKERMLETKHRIQQAEQEKRQLKLILQKNLEKINLLKSQLERQSDIIETFKSADNIGSQYLRLTDDEWHGLEIALDDVYSRFVSKLRQDFPSMSEDGLRLCMLQKIGLTTHQMSNIFSVSPLSITKRKQRLKTKYFSSENNKATFDEIIEKM